MTEPLTNISNEEKAGDPAFSCFDKLKTIFHRKNYCIDKNSDLYLHIRSETEFLSDDKTPIKQRLWHILNKTFEVPKCKYCDNLVKWNSADHKYCTYCSFSCRNKDPEFTSCTKNEHTKQKRKNTNIQKYGGTTPAHSKEVMSKMKSTMIEKYGVDNPLKSEELKNKQKRTIIEKYGVDNVSKLSDVKQKKKETLFYNYGVTSTMDIPGFERVTSEKLRSGEVRKKKVETNNKKYGRDSHRQTHIDPGNILLLNDRNWLEEQHIKLQYNCAYIARILGVDRHTVANKIKQFDIGIKRYYRSAPEIEIYNHISNFVQCDHNVRNIICKELDIYIPSKNIAIEYCGLFWHSEDSVGKHYHREKYLECKNNGIRLIQIFEDEWLYNKNLILKKLEHILGISNDRKIYARNCIIKEVSSGEKTVFFNNTHIQGDGPSSINYGLYNNEELVACMGFIKKNNVLVLNRYSTLCNVVGGFSKLLNNFKQFNIETFADLRWSVGELYEKNGFELVQEIKEDYSYCKGQKRFHKFGFRLKHLKNKLAMFDENLTEYENCSMNGYYRIWDAGKLKYFKKAES